MKILVIRQKLIDYIKVADAVKVKALYTLLEDEIDQPEIELTEEQKAELNRRYAYYKNGGEMISEEESKKRINELLQSSKQKSTRP